jgi:hypothetical protein
VETVNTKLVQTVSKADMEARLDNLANRLEVKYDGAVKKTNDGQGSILRKSISGRKVFEQIFIFV